MKRSKRIMYLVLSFVMLILFIVPSFAVSTNFSSFIHIPDDLGNEVTLPSSSIDDTIHKYYLVVRIYSVVDTNVDITINYNYYYNQENINYTCSGSITNSNFNITTITRSSQTSFIFMPYISVSSNNYSRYMFYIPIYLRNAQITSIVEEFDGFIALYESTSDESTIAAESFTLGYNTGYDIGYDDGFSTAANVVADLPLVEKLSVFIASFTGEDTARYITPLAICMILILIYCLFIRWILNLARSSKLTRLTDIVVLVSCIAILLIYYIPMIDFTINQNQTVENIYRIINDVNVGG